MSSASDWEVPDYVDQFLVTQLAKGKLALVLGAGVSMGFGLPNWTDLVDELYRARGKVRQAGLSDVQASEVLLHSEFSTNRVAFAEAVRQCLFRNYWTRADLLLNSALLQAIGALTVRSVRGSAGLVISFNFDDLLERYLRLYGFVAKPVAELPRWDGRADVFVYHPHGLLSSERSATSTRGVVFVESDYNEVLGNAENLWHQRLQEALIEHTCLFIGLSGADPNLSLAMQKAEKVIRNSGKRPEHCWGIRICKQGDPMNELWATKGVHCYEVVSFEEIPRILLNLCRLAAESDPF